MIRALNQEVRTTKVAKKKWRCKNTTIGPFFFRKYTSISLSDEEITNYSKNSQEAFFSPFFCHYYA